MFTCLGSRIVGAESEGLKGLGFSVAASDLPRFRVLGLGLGLRVFDCSLCFERLFVAFLTAGKRSL